MIPFPDKKYKIILVDCPWSYQNFRDKSHGAASAYYPCMSIKQIASLPVQDIADDNCALFLWITGPKLAEGAHLPLMWSWGFRPVCVAFVWNKTYASGKPYCGLGFYTRSATEFCFLGIKGKMKRLDANVRQVISCPVQGHSRKPKEIYGRIEDLFGPQTRIELFARGSPQPYWENWGLESTQGEVTPCDVILTTNKFSPST